MLPSDQQSEIAAILEALRAEVRAQRQSRSDVEQGSALSVIERELHHAAEQLEITRVVSAHWPLEGRTLYERAWILVHKVVRRGLRWYINPIVEQQNAFNDSATRAVRLLIEAESELRDQIAALQRQLALPASSSGPPAPAGDHPATPPTSPVAAPPPPPPAADEPGSLAAELATRRTVHAHWELGGPGPLGLARGFVQRVVRQYLRWLINPIVEQQNGYNEALALALPRLSAANRELRARLGRLPAPPAAGSAGTRAPGSTP